MYKGLLAVQRAIGVNRFRKYEKKGYKQCYGSGWFSITRNFAEYLIENKKTIEQIYSKFTYIPDESFVQTFLYKSKYYKNIYKADYLDGDLNRANMRLIFWSGKTSPDTITVDYLDKITNCPHLFARKFDWDTDREIIFKIKELISKN